MIPTWKERLAALNMAGKILVRAHEIDLHQGVGAAYEIAYAEVCRENGYDNRLAYRIVMAAVREAER